MKLYLKTLTFKELDEMCLNHHPICENCPLYMNNPIYHMKECAINHNTWKIRDEYRDYFIKLKK